MDKGEILSTLKRHFNGCGVADLVLCVYGSVQRGSFSPYSDVDLLIYAPEWVQFHEESVYEALRTSPIPVDISLSPSVVNSRDSLKAYSRGAHPSFFIAMYYAEPFSGSEKGIHEFMDTRHDILMTPQTNKHIFDFYSHMDSLRIYNKISSDTWNSCVEGFNKWGAYRANLGMINEPRTNMNN